MTSNCKIFSTCHILLIHERYHLHILGKVDSKVKVQRRSFCTTTYGKTKLCHQYQQQHCLSHLALQSGFQLVSKNQPKQ